MYLPSLPFLLTLILGIHSWTFSETNNETCISMTGDIQFNLKPSETTALAVSIPKEPASVNVSGRCELDSATKQSELILKWDEYTAFFIFIQNVNVSSTNNSFWYAEKVSLYKDDEIIISTLASDQLFKTHAGYFYTCTGKKTYVTYAVDPVTKIPDKNKGTGNMDVSNITVQPFKSLQNMDDSKKEVCSADPPKPTEPKPKPPTPKPKPQPTPAPQQFKPSGGRVAWTCTVIALMAISVCAIFIYHNKDATPQYGVV